MKYIKAEKQMQMLDGNRFDELIAYAEQHNLSRKVVIKLLTKIKQQQTNQVATSIH